MIGTQAAKTVPPAWLSERIEAGERVYVLDVRSPGEFAAGHIPGAVNIPLEQVEARLKDIPDGAKIVVACQHGPRADLACQAIRDSRPEAIKLEGGTAAWASEGRPLVRCSAARWSLERQVRLIVGLLAIIGSVLALTVDLNWIALPLILGCGLTFAGLTDICGLGLLLSRMPWNRSKQ